MGKDIPSWNTVGSRVTRSAVHQSLRNKELGTWDWYNFPAKHYWNDGNRVKFRPFIGLSVSHLQALPFFLGLYAQDRGHNASP